VDRPLHTGGVHISLQCLRHPFASLKKVAKASTSALTSLVLGVHPYAVLHGLHELHYRSDGRGPFALTRDGGGPSEREIEAMALTQLQCLALLAGAPQDLQAQLDEWADDATALSHGEGSRRRAEGAAASAGAAPDGEVLQGRRSVIDGGHRLRNHLVQPISSGYLAHFFGENFQDPAKPHHPHQPERSCVWTAFL
jgi:hypothetical protein